MGAFPPAASPEDLVPQCAEPITPPALRRILGFDTPFFEKFKAVFVHEDAAALLNTSSYDRYEFIGDAVINLLCAKFLYDNFEGNEGFLTKSRSKLVCTKSLAYMAQRLGLPKYVIMTKKAFETSYNTNPRVAEDIFESLVGCLYETHGLLEAKRFFLKQLDEAYGATGYSILYEDDNYKDACMRYCQALGLPLPTYHVVPPVLDAAPSGFKCCVMLNGKQSGFGMGTTKKAAEQLAAKEALGKLGLLDGSGYVDSSKIGRKNSQ